MCALADFIISGVKPAISTIRKLIQLIILADTVKFLTTAKRQFTGLTHKNASIFNTFMPLSGSRARKIKLSLNLVVLRCKENISNNYNIIN